MFSSVWLALRSRPCWDSSATGTSLACSSALHASRPSLQTWPRSTELRLTRDALLNRIRSVDAPKEPHYHQIMMSLWHCHISMMSSCLVVHHVSLCLAQCCWANAPCCSMHTTKASGCRRPTPGAQQPSHIVIITWSLFLHFSMAPTY